MNLTPEQIKAWLNSQNALYGTDASQGNAITGIDPRTLTGFAQSVDPTHYQMWDSQGVDQGVQQRTPDSWLDKNMEGLTLAALAGMTGAGLFGGGGGLAANGLEMTVPTAAESAANAGSLMQSLAPYEAGASSLGAGALNGLEMTVPTEAQSLIGQKALEADLAPYLAKTGGLLGSAASTAGKTAGTGLLGSVGATDLAKIAAIGLGAAAGSKPTTTTNTSQSKTDPRIDPYIYGDDGILAQAKNWQQANQTGLNDQMLQGLNMQYNVNANPENMGAYQQMQRLGSGLMSAPIAGNPFTTGGTRNLGFSNQNAGMSTPNASPYVQPKYMK